MAIFSKKTALQELEAEHDRLKRQSDSWAKKTEDARSEVDRATAALDSLLDAEADDAKARKSAQRRVDDATSELRTFETKLASTNEKVSIAARRVGEERIRIGCKAEADQITKRTAVFAKRFEVALAELRAASEAAGELAHVSFELNEIAKFAQATGSELDVACSKATHDLREVAELVREGRTRIPGKPAPAPVPLPAPVTERVWVVKSLAWTEGGMTQIRDSNNWVDLPPGLAKIAISKGAAVPLGHERAGKHLQNFRQFHGGGLPALENCIGLDDATETTSDEEKPRAAEQQIVHSAFQQRLPPGFERIDRGPVFTVKTAPGNTAGEAA